MEHSLKKPEYILVTALGRSDAGVTQYAAAILSEMEQNRQLKLNVCISRFAQFKWYNKLPQLRYFSIFTYRNKLEFILSSVTVYPILLLSFFISLVFNRYQKLYLPYFHHWDLGFIWLFRLFGKKVVYTVHDGIMHYGEEDRLGQWIMLKSVAAATEVIFLTEAVKNRVLPQIKTKATFHVIPHGIFELDGIQFAKPYVEKPVLLFIGRISRYKGIELLLEALEQIDPALYDKCIIAGKSNYPIFPKLTPQIEFIDKYLSEDEIVSYLNQSHIMIMPYLEASQSGVATLAIAAEMPVVACSVGGLPEQLSDGAIWVRPDVQSLAQGIKSILGNEAYYLRLQKNLAKIRKETEWKNITAQITKTIMT